MSNWKKSVLVIIILLLAAFLRFYNLMHDRPYFFNPDERNMASAITQLRLPKKLSAIPICLINQFSPVKPDAGRFTPDAINCSLNPHFFAYGQFPLYLSYLSDQLTKPISTLFHAQPTTDNPSLTTNFDSAIFWLRFYSALTSTFTVLLVFLISRQFFTFHFSLFTAIITAFTPGLIQSAHFGTTESLLTFFFMVAVHLAVRYLSSPRQNGLRKSINHNSRFIILNSLTTGLALGSKLTGIFFLVPPALSLLMKIVSLSKMTRRQRLTGLAVYLAVGMLVVLGSIIVAVISSPYNLVEPRDFMSAVFGYEADVASGKYAAFYTRQFAETIPVLFQTEKIFPYALGWPVFVLGSIGFLLTLFLSLTYPILTIMQKYQISKIKYQKYISNIKNNKIFALRSLFLIIDLSFLIYFIPNSFLFVKWTRFMTPIFPFFAIFSSFTVFFFQTITMYMGKVQNQSSNPKSSRFLTMVFIIAFCTLSILPGLAFFSIYTRPDSRVTASRWIYENIPDGSYVLSETANVIDIPLGISSYPVTDGKTLPNYTVISFDFYHMDENPKIFSNLLLQLEKAEFIFIPSRRIFANYMRLPREYPLVNKYYQLLFSGKLGFEKATQISSFPNLEIGNWKLDFDDEQSEESYTVFDHPVIRIYKKISPMTRDQYQSLFENDKLL